MSELINVSTEQKDIRWSLLTTVSVMALVIPVSASLADTGDRPTVWIELGGQLEHQTIEPAFAPPFLLGQSQPTFGAVNPLMAGKAPQYSYGAEGKITFRPAGMDWVFSAALRYGRSSNNKRVHQSGDEVHSSAYTAGGYTLPLNLAPMKFVDVTTAHEESHLVLDFQVGNDVGIGSFADKSMLSLGVRFAQFNTKAQTHISSFPNYVIRHFRLGAVYFPGLYGNYYFGSLDTKRSFEGVGPSLSWTGRIPLMKNGRGEELTVDLGINGAVLFGRQKADVHHETKEEYVNGKFAFISTGVPPRSMVYDNLPPTQARVRSVVVPNIGGQVGFSVRYSNATVAFGYRADVFFNAMDDGLDKAHSANQIFHGPFASMSIGLGG